MDSNILHIPSNYLTFGALAVEGVDPVYALAVVETRLTGTLIRIDVAEDTLVS